MAGNERCRQRIGVRKCSDKFLLEEFLFHTILCRRELVW